MSGRGYFLGVQFLLEEFAHVVMAQMGGRHNNVARFLPLELDDSFSKVCLHHVDSALLKVRVHLALLGEHRFRLHKFLYAVVFKNGIYYFVEFLRVFGSVHFHAVFLGGVRKLFEIAVDVGESVAFQFRRFSAQAFPLRGS